jgi:hypothetical protein
MLGSEVGWEKRVPDMIWTQAWVNVGMKRAKLTTKLRQIAWLIQWLRRSSGNHTLAVVEYKRRTPPLSETGPDKSVRQSRQTLGLLAGIVLLWGIFTGATNGTATAQDPPTYDQAIFGSGLDSEVSYVNPNGTGDATADRLEPRPQPQPLVSPDNWPSWGSDIAQVIPYLILIVVVALAWKYGASLRLARRRTPEAGKRADTAVAPNPAHNKASEATGSRGGIEEIARISDRDRALALLLSHLLEYALARHQGHFRHSQTVREALRALPSNSPVVPPLREITGYVERVRFGGHKVSEPVFQRFLESGRAVLQHDPQTVPK